MDPAMFRKFLRDENAATAIEYGLIATLIAVAIVGGASALGGEIGHVFGCMNAVVDDVGPRSHPACGALGLAG